MSELFRTSNYQRIAWTKSSAIWIISITVEDYSTRLRNKLSYTLYLSLNYEILKKKCEYDEFFIFIKKYYLEWSVMDFFLDNYPLKLPSKFLEKEYSEQPYSKEVLILFNYKKSF